MKKIITAFAILYSFVSVAQNKDTIHSVSFLKSKGLTASWHSCQMIYRDTCLDTTMWVQRHLNCFEYSYHNNDYEHDTVFIYNHYQFLRQKVDQEMMRYGKLVLKTPYGVKELEYRQKYDYYRGMSDLLNDILYHDSRRIFPFVSKDTSNPMWLFRH